MSIQNMRNKSGIAVPNQFIIRDDKRNIFFKSYDSMIAKWDGKVLMLGYNWDYSRNTMKYLKSFIESFTNLDSGDANIRKQIDKGIILYDSECK